MILSVLVILSAYSGIYFAELQAAGRTKPIFIEGLISAMVYLMLLLSLTMWLKQIGAAIARALMVITAFVILYNSIKMKMPDNIMKSIIMSIVMAFILSLVESFLNVSLYAKALIEALNFCNSVASLL
ncbi:MAG: polysaccharide biosynthesis C-terminal domain-containing protein [Nitrososphaerales archaeon]